MAQSMERRFSKWEVIGNVGCCNDFLYLVCRGVASYSTSRGTNSESDSITVGTPGDIRDTHDEFAE